MTSNKMWDRDISIEQMRKKYLIKQPSSQANLHLQYSSILNNTQNTDTKPRGTHNNRASRVQINRLKTQPANHEPSPHSLKKRESSVGIAHKRRYILPNNKENIKQEKKFASNRFTYNEYRASEITDNERTNLEMTINNNRYSEAKQVPKKSMQKMSKMEMFKICSPKRIKRATEDSVQIHNLKSFTMKNHNAAQNDFPGEVRLEDLQMEQQIGSGTFGKVYCARVKSSGVKVAVKRVQQDKKYKTRELQIVKMLESPYVVKILGTFTTDQGRHQYLNIIMETFESNFFEMLRAFSVPSLLDLKCYTYQMIRGLLYLHTLGVCHRDLKPQNMLVKNKKLVICDFGSAKILKPGEQNISYICSRCYRAPELIFQATNYTSKIDMWSLGCIFLEILNGRPLFIADSSLNHILEVIKVLGTPTKTDVRDMNPNYEINEYDLPQIKKKHFKNLFPTADPLFLDLTEKLVKYSPQKRFSAAEALVHPFFDELREEKHFKPSGKLYGFDHFFSFQQEVLPIGMRDKIIPKWYTSQ